MKKICMLLVMMCLNGCALYHMEDNLRSMYGMPIDVAFQVLGIPDGTFNFSHMTVYVWSHSQGYSYSVPQSSVTNGYMGGVPGYSFHYMTEYQENRSGTSSCKIKIMANRQGRIVQTDYDGGILACEAYADKLEAAFRM